MIDFDISRAHKGRTFAFSPENPTGARSGGSKDQPWEKNHACVCIKPGETLTLADTDGPGRIQSMWIGGDITANFIIRFYWDGREEPSAEAPLPAFFGYAFADNVRGADGNFPTLNSSMVMVAPCRGMNCFWPMPFRKHCRITLTNRSPVKELWTYYTITGILEDVSEDALYFHACYRQSFPTPRDGVYTVLDGVNGRGHLAGVALFAATNGSNGCWVEGEMKMYIDGETYPSVNYTGTEDYFCGSYAFGYDKPEIGRYQQYSGLYSGMFAVLGSREGRYDYQPRFMMYRWHVPDPICFDRSIRAVIQNIHYTQYGCRPRRDDYSSTAYWYQNLPSSPLKPLPSDEELEVR